MANWLGTQDWQRDGDSPCLSLGSSGAFDDAHIFAPCVAYADGAFLMWYCGARGAVAERVFRLGLATSQAGVRFGRHPRSPVLGFADGRRSILTPALLRYPDGSVRRQNGKLLMWFSASDLTTEGGLHALHMTSSRDGLTWELPSEALLEHVYAPTIIQEDGIYRMWYTDVEREPWSIRYAESYDGRDWRAAADAVLVLDQLWEHQRLFYPTVLKADGLYVMWYGSYSHSVGQEMRTALGCAVSKDGLHWKKNAHNPVFGPEPSHRWESHYTTSQSVLRLPDGSWRIWYASRPAPPFDHKYFAIGTARWLGPDGSP
jgi:predicted GH43/DUF377 family glycosyl hydrolase